MTGHHDFQLADDIIHKVHIGHYTFYSVAVVKNNKLFIKARGVFARKYIGGEGIDDIEKDGTKNTEDKPLKLYTIDQINEKMQKARTVASTGGTDLSVFSDDKDATALIAIPGSYVSKFNQFVNPLGFGAFSYQGCKAGREGRGMPLDKRRTLEDMKIIRDRLNTGLNTGSTKSPE